MSQHALLGRSRCESTRSNFQSLLFSIPFCSLSEGEVVVIVEVQCHLEDMYQFGQEFDRYETIVRADTASDVASIARFPGHSAWAV